MPAPGLNPHRARVTGTPQLPRLRALALLRRRPECGATPSLADVRETCTQADLNRALPSDVRVPVDHVRCQRHRANVSSLCLDRQLSGSRA